MGRFLEATFDKLIFRVATDRLYGRAGLWVLPVAPPGSQRVRIGVADFLQQSSGDCAFATVKPVGTPLRAGDDLAELETIKVNQVLASPVSGTIVAVNEALASSPEKINQSPYDDGWLAEVQTTDWDQERSGLLEPSAYFEVMQALAREELAKP